MPPNKRNKMGDTSICNWKFIFESMWYYYKIQFGALKLKLISIIIILLRTSTKWNTIFSVQFESAHKPRQYKIYNQCAFDTEQYVVKWFFHNTSAIDLKLMQSRALQYTSSIDRHPIRGQWRACKWSKRIYNIRLFAHSYMCYQGRYFVVIYLQCD